MRLPVYSFRKTMLLLMLATTLLTQVISGNLIFLIRSRTLNRSTRQQVEKTVEDIAHRMEDRLQDIEILIEMMLQASELMTKDNLSTFIENSMDQYHNIRALYFMDENNLSYAVWTHESLDPLKSTNQGIDFSYSSLYLEAKAGKGMVWSDKFVSILSGDTSIGLALFRNGRGIIAEMDLDIFTEILLSITDNWVRLWVVDRRGELVVDTMNSQTSGVINVSTEPVFKNALANEPLPSNLFIEGINYYPSMALTDTLRWIVIAGKPTGLDDRLIQDVLIDLILISISFFLISMIIFIIWTHRISSYLVSLCDQADQIIEGKVSPYWKPGSIKEFNDLSRYLKQLLQDILERENRLRIWNRELEDRISQRTLALEESNRELKNALEHNHRMQDVLVDSEKQAALGRLVAGVAHELNTPLGNALMVVSSLQDEEKTLREEMKEGLRKSVLDHFIEQTRKGLEIAEKNMVRAADLIMSFKHVANDQTHSIRRNFYLKDILKDVLITLNPQLKRTRLTIESRLDEDIEMNSYPGVISQIFTNLITNAILHGWDKNEEGNLILSSGRLKEPFLESSAHESWVFISVEDNGKGIDPSLGKKIFEPFFSTKMGNGGTGLGLHISFNGARNILGGILEYSSSPGCRTIFTLKIPRVAPVLSDNDEINNSLY